MSTELPFSAVPYFFCRLNLAPPSTEMVQARARLPVVFCGQVSFAFQSIERTDGLHRGPPTKQPLEHRRERFVVPVPIEIEENKGEQCRSYPTDLRRRKLQREALFAQSADFDRVPISPPLL